MPRGVKDTGRILGRDGQESGWLLGVRELHSQRAPGTTCMSALGRMSDDVSLPAKNDSKGCGGVMRVAPIAFLVERSIEERFALACRAAAITHGHPTGILSSGALVWMLARLLEGVTLAEAVEETIVRVGREASSEETVAALRGAVALYRSAQAPTPELVETLGGGWTGEEALAIGTYAALVAGEDFGRAVRIGVNHSGDSDSTGSIAGQIVGVQVGVERIEGRWLERLELREVIERMAQELMSSPSAAGSK